MDVQESTDATAVFAAASDVVRELIDGTAATGGYVLNSKDPGLLKSLEALSAADASRIHATAATSIAAHVDHVRYGLSLFNRWSRGEDNPFSSADWGASWKRVEVSDEQWTALRRALADEAHAWVTAIKTPRAMNHVALRGVVASVVHLGYHVGAIRQMDQRLRGPKENG
jgi:hypothetical protein